MLVQEELEALASSNYEAGQYDATVTESAYLSEHRPGPNVPNQSHSFVHSIIQSHIGGRIDVNMMQAPVFSQRA